MTPKEKAEELINGFLYLQVDNYGYDYAKLCALKTVDELIDSWNKELYENCGASIYWQEVKEEINKL